MFSPVKVSRVVVQCQSEQRSSCLLQQRVRSSRRGQAPRQMGGSRSGLWRSRGFQLACDLGLPGRNQACGQLHRSGLPMSGGTKRRFSKPPVVVAGDLNSNSQWDANRPRTKSHGGSSLIRESRSNRLISAYHAHNGENPGNETRPTYYLYRPSAQAIPPRLRVRPEGLAAEIGRSRVVRSVGKARRPRSGGG